MGHLRAYEPPGGSPAAPSAKPGGACPRRAGLRGEFVQRRPRIGGGPLEELAATAGYRIESTGRLPLLRYVVAVRPGREVA